MPWIWRHSKSQTSYLWSREMATALKAGCEELLLETGPYQPEALAFYSKQGYARRGPFGAYPDHPLSVFMGKRLVHQEADA
jgi:hypothetical protein